MGKKRCIILCDPEFHLTFYTRAQSHHPVTNQQNQACNLFILDLSKPRSNILFVTVCDLDLRFDIKQPSAVEKSRFGSVSKFLSLKILLILTEWVKTPEGLLQPINSFWAN